MKPSNSSEKNRITVSRKLQKVRWALEYLRTNSGRANLRAKALGIIEAALKSDIADETQAMILRASNRKEESLAFAPEQKVRLKDMSSNRARIQKSGFSEDAKIPGSHIRKIDK